MGCLLIQIAITVIVLLIVIGATLGGVAYVIIRDKCYKTFL